MPKIKQSIVRYIAALLMLALTPVYAELAGSRAVWETAIEIDEFTDEKGIVSGVVSTEEGYISLIRLSCRSKSFRGSIGLEAHLGTKRINVRYRVDKNEPVTLIMRADHGKKKNLQITVISFNDMDSRFVRDLMNGKETVLIWLSTPDNYILESYTMRFTLNGAAAAIRTVLEACGKK